ncbi:MAG: RHS repeat-associated core domain-containing protein [Planctomycetota bacterium]
MRRAHAYDDNPLMTEVLQTTDAVDAGGQTRFRHYAYDTAGRAVGSFTGPGEVVGGSRELSPGGAILAETLHLDDRGETGVVSPSEPRETRSYDSYGYLSGITDHAGNPTTIANGTLGLPTKITDAEGGELLFTYDTQGQVRSREERGPDGLSRTELYDYLTGFGLTGITDALERTTSFVRDGFGRVRQRILPDLSSETFEYDGTDRLTGISRPGGVDLALRYGADGYLDTLTATGADADVTRIYGHDVFGNPTSILDQVAGRPPVIVAREYSSAGDLLADAIAHGPHSAAFLLDYEAPGLLAKLTYPSGRDVQRGHDERGRVTAIQSSFAGLVGTFAEHYGESGYRRFTLASGAVEQEYDHRGRIVERRIRGSQGSLIGGSSQQYSPTGDLLARQHYGASTTETFVYDGLHRLKSWQHSGSLGVRDRTWTLDLADNVEHVFDSVHGSEDPSFNLLNQLTASVPSLSAVSYTSNGGEASSTSSSGETETWRWDALGRPLDSTRTELVGGVPVVTLLTEWTFDGLDRLVKRSRDGAETIYDHVGDVPGAVTTSQSTTEYVGGMDLDAPVARVVDDGAALAWSYVHTGPFRNVEAYHDGHSLSWRTEFDPYGTPRDPSTGQPLSGHDDALLFLAKPYDGELGLSHLGNRLFRPSQARFVERDPLGELGGTNLYSYPGLNPYRFIDPTGLIKQESSAPLAKVTDPDPPTTPDAGVIKTGTAQGGKPIGSFIELMNEFIKKNHDKLGLDPNRSFSDLDTVDQSRALDLAYAITRDLLLNYFAAQWGAPHDPNKVVTPEEARALHRGALEIQKQRMAFPVIALFDGTWVQRFVSSSGSAIEEATGGSIRQEQVETAAEVLGWTAAAYGVAKGVQSLWKNRGGIKRGLRRLFGSEPDGTARGATEIGEALGQLRSGSSSQIKLVDSPAELEGLFGKLSAGGQSLDGVNYPGRMVLLPDGTRVGIRSGSRSGGPTIDVHPPTGPRWKVHVGGEQ